MKYTIYTLTLLAGLTILCGSSANTRDHRTLSFFHTHTGKSLEVTYFHSGDYDRSALADINSFMADWRDGEQAELDPEVMDILWRIEQITGHTDTWEIISAYRSPRTNEMLRSRSSGVAKNSQHIEGNAVDVRLRGLELSALRDAAIGLEAGGVGYYPGSDFVHVDTGRVRTW